jgi:hypothetical protein
LKPADVEAKSVALKEEAKTLADTISAPALDEKSTEILKLSLRRGMVEEISKITRDLETKARKEEEETVRFPALNGGKEVWICFFLLNTGETGCYATLMKKESARDVAADMRKKRFVGKTPIAGAKVWYMRHMSFVKAIEGLKKDILDGKHDEKLSTDTAKLIFDALKDKAV